MDLYRIRRWLICPALIVAATACRGDSGVTTTTVDEVAEPTEPTTTSVPATTATTVLDAQEGIDWFVAVLNGEEVDEEGYDIRFSPQFRRQVPFVDGFQPLVDRLRPFSPFTIVERSGEGVQGEAVAEGSDGTRVGITAELDADGRFAGLLVEPVEVPTLADPPGSIEQAHDGLSEIGELRSLAAEVIDGRCEPVDSVDPDDPAPIGSIFKLYVLAAVGEEVDAGNMDWDEEVVIRDELKSVPTGTLQDRSDGETVTVREAAELMISTSDNTATDHLIDLLGRDRVAAAMTDYGNTTPELNTPLLTTRELSALKVGPAEGLRVQWIEGDEETRRSILRQISDITPDDLPIDEWQEPRDPDLVEWFATPADLCTLAVRLLELEERVPEVGAILSVEPGVPSETAWDRHWFKGGSEPGLIAAWFVTEVEGRVFVATGSVVDAESTVDSDEATLLFSTVRDLLAP